MFYWVIDVLILDTEEGSNEREETLICCSTFPCIIGWFWLGIKPTTLAHGDNGPIKWATLLELLLHILKATYKIKLIEVNNMMNKPDTMIPTV